MKPPSRSAWRQAQARRVRATRDADRRVGQMRRRFRVLAKPRSTRGLLALCVGVFFAVVLIGLGGPYVWARVQPVTAPSTPKGHVVVGSIRTVDGDTLAIDGDKVRIANIDAAEMPPGSRCHAEQVLAQRATDRLRGLIGTADAVVFLPDPERERDRYGRLLGRIEIDGVDVGRQLVDEGLARRWTGRRHPWC